MKKNTIIIVTITSIFIVVPMAVYAFKCVREQKQFSDISNSVNRISGNIKGIVTEKDIKYCQRNNMKYSAGSLGCFVDKKISTEKNNSILGLDDSISRESWKSLGSSLDFWKPVDDRYIVANTYQYKDADCYLRIKAISSNKQEITVGCEKSALRAWYPMKD